MPQAVQQQLSVLTLGVADPARSRRFYAEGFGWTPVFEIPGEIVFFQMNGFVLGLWRRDALAEDTNRPAASGSGAFALAHNVAAAEDVRPALDRLVAAGGQILRNAEAPPPRRAQGLRRRSRRPCLGNRLQPGMDHRRRRQRHLRGVTGGRSARKAARALFLELLRLRR
tara:strand:+ start:40 stop:546 length:507 start_codon:yes stop_codon:yes gene_type:complete